MVYNIRYSSSNRRSKSKIEEVKECIKQYRTKYIVVSKEVKYLQLKRYYKEKGIKEISKSSIWGIIKKLKEEEKILSKKELHMNGETWSISKIKRKKKNRYSYRNMKIKELGEIVQIDSIHLRCRDIKL